MARFRRFMCACTIAAFLAAAGASVASAQTFYANQRNGSNAFACTSPAEPCKTIAGAVARAEASPPPNKILLNAEEGPFKELVALTTIHDNNLTIEGEEPEAGIATSGKDAVVVGAVAGSVTLANLKISATATPAAVRDMGANIKLSKDVIETEEAANGVEAAGGGSVAIEGGEVIMERSTGYAAYAKGAALSVAGAQIFDGHGGAEPESGGVYSENSTLAVTGTQIHVETGPTTVAFGIAAGKDSAVTIASTSVQQGSPAIGVALELDHSVSVNGLNVEMRDAAAVTEGVLDETNAGASSSFSHLQVSGGWMGPALVGFGGALTLSDSRVSTNGASNSPALRYSGPESGAGVLVQRSVVVAAPGAKPGALAIEAANATIDSSEILGGSNGVLFEGAEGASDTLTLSASTVDAGATGIAGDAAGVTGVDAVAKAPKSVAKATVQGSIVLEKQSASAAPGDEAGVACAYTAAPSQLQTAGGGGGAISCAAGSSGNSEVSPLSALFAEPLSAYTLNPSSSAVDSVSAEALSLPFGLTPSPTDLAGNPRVVDGNGDCIAIQDKGALELQGHSAPCPMPPPVKTSTSAPKPLAGVITALTISPNAFSAAPKGATISRAKKAKKKYGAKISYRDSQAGTTTFTVLMPVTGRTQGRSCRKPSKANRHGRRCTLYKALGTFTHADVAGLNSLHFSGRLRGKKLAKGSYSLQAVPHDAAGNGAAVSVKFTIKK
jgi:hypothetical protein